MKYLFKNSISGRLARETMKVNLVIVGKFLLLISACILMAAWMWLMIAGITLTFN